MGGSASIHSHEKNIFGHDGLMGSQVPIAVGHCYATRKSNRRAKPLKSFIRDTKINEEMFSLALEYCN